MRFLGMSQGQDFEMVDAARVDRDMHALIALRIASFQPMFAFSVRTLANSSSLRFLNRANFRSTSVAFLAQLY